MRIVALVPIRHYSARVKGKNYRSFNGKPLFFWIINTLAKSKLINEIIINTNSPVVKEGAPEISNKVKIIDRPDQLCADTVPMNDIIHYDICNVDADYYVQTHVTHPLLTIETIEKAVNTFLQNDKYDSLFGVTKLQDRFWNLDGVAVNHDPQILLRTQDLPPIYKENSSIYIFSKESFSNNNNRIGNNPYMFEIGNIETYDIDTETDFIIAEQLMKVSNRFS